MDTLFQLVTASSRGGQFGDVRRWDNMSSNDPSLTGTILSANNNFAGGYSSVLVYSGATGGESASSDLDGTMETTIAAGDAALANASYRVGSSTGTAVGPGRGFTSGAWFDQAL
jgi:hypothetical protein